MIHPDNDDGDALRRLESHGDDLTKPRDINFSVVFSQEHSAEQFAEHFRSLGYKISVQKSGVIEKLPFDVTVVSYMIPSYEGIVEFENTLNLKAKELGGQNDGWGCISQNSFSVAPN